MTQIKIVINRIMAIKTNLVETLLLSSRCCKIVNNLLNNCMRVLVLCNNIGLSQQFVLTSHEYIVLTKVNLVVSKIDEN